MILLNKPIAPSIRKLSSYLTKVNDNGWYTNFGPLHQELTFKLEEYLGIKNLLLVANGTLALHVTYRALGVKNAICTPFSYVATGSSLAWENIPFSFLDIDEKSLNLNPHLAEEIIKKDKNVDTIIATHVYGNPCNVVAFDNLRDKYNTKVIYDAAHAFNVKLKDKALLNFGDASTLSFHATKVFHTVEGGGIVFKSRDAFNRAKNIINFGLDPHGNLGQDGINAKLSEYHCAVGLTLLDIIDEVLEHRSEIWLQYKKNLESFFELPRWDKDASINGSYFPIILPNIAIKKKIKKFLEEKGIPTREYFSPSLNEVYKKEEICPIAESISSRVLCLPLHYYICKEDVQFISENLKKSIL